MSGASRWREFFEESNGRLSSKRLAGLVAAFALVATLLAQTAAAILIAIRHPELPAVPLDGTVVMTVGALALGGLGLSTWEKHIAEKNETARRQTTVMQAIPEGRP